MSDTIHEPEGAAAESLAPQSFTRADFMSLTKARLSMLVVVTTLAGYIVGVKTGLGGFSGWALFHTILGTTLAAFGSAVFNQLMEVDADSRMKRTASRPLPARRIPPSVAFVLGWLLSGIGVVHLGKMVNTEASALAAATLVIYLFIYTPMKRRSVWNTIVGAVSGAIPPVIGYAAAAGPGMDGIRWALFVQPAALFLFGLLFFWQLPHFLAINWMYRDEYVRGGFVMWSNNDDTGSTTGLRAVVYSVALLLTTAAPPFIGLSSWWFLPAAVVTAGYMIFLSGKLWKNPDRAAARKLFFYTLLY
ncbi:MAG: protoheme IX farnesyltransferase, partial [Verrucomicrobiales bacterium]